MRAVLWSDYLCPWCYLGRDRSAVLRELGVEVTHLPFELHPELPPTGRDVRDGGRLAAVYATVARECERADMPFRAPAHVPNTRLALETAEAVRRTAPHAFAAVDDALFRAHFVDGRDIGDPDVVDEIVRAAGAPTITVLNAVTRGDASTWVDDSMADAHEHGIAATPAWRVGELVIPGVQPRDTMRRWVVRLLERERRTS
jgi:predicted DsbA family dithiol-disulfide isomerase